MTLDATYQRACAVTDVARASAIAVEVNDTPIAIVHGADGEFYATYDECSHAQIPLSEGDVEAQIDALTEEGILGLAA